MRTSVKKALKRYGRYEFVNYYIHFYIIVNSLYKYNAHNAFNAFNAFIKKVTLY